MPSATTPALWVKSTYSSGEAACVEIADLAHGDCSVRFIRDSKLGEGSPVLAVSGDQWAAFTAGVTSDEFA